MLELNLPPFPVKTKMIDQKPFIWDRIRKKYIALTPEEWVRQHFVNYLIEYKSYPESLMANEKQVLLNSQKKRCDSVVYNRELKPLLVVEYKSPDVKITQDVFDQIVRYNMVLKVAYLVVSNGLQHYCCSIDYDTQSYNYLPDIPAYCEI
ncbi:type I restriction enzyme HsdR N-terminal domain-containing protein [Dysgonomonas sp. 520]|uniref:type I restriction enzyme HsdR N-terminal domain-containing protein n=1 Tax=Dysgonomonas sp. 520 TaxID=2302931 RepID=UPI0013D6669F|nr:type I restriction enzyme HsdR N-terminal domain-containing protein [Dysgonomonas sp. 520]NDW10379.1 hypothetical protein [Dysgonomonas sp. 520]